MKIQKLFWALRLIILKPFFGQVGSESYLGRPLFIQRKKSIFIGKKVRIYPEIRIETPDKNSRIFIGNDVSIGQNFHIVSYQDDLIIGNSTTISGNVFVSNVDHDYTKVGISALKQPLIKKKTKIGNNCFIGYGAVILPGTVLGDNCIVGANAVVKGVFPSNCVIAGVPAHIIKKYNLKTGNWDKVNQ